uniref:Uncharacterized protein n=1 Tax=Cacopsylla melanoneura TaxID=428564 RepID=A0A8D8THA6_9HEMI
MSGRIEVSSENIFKITDTKIRSFLFFTYLSLSAYQKDYKTRSTDRFQSKIKSSINKKFKFFMQKVCFDFATFREKTNQLFCWMVRHVHTVYDSLAREVPVLFLFIFTFNF